MSSCTERSRDAERSIDGSRVVITGATNGIGLEIARGLARRGAALTLLARNLEKAAATAAELVSIGAVDADIVEADLSSAASVRAAAAVLHDRLRQIDVLVNNAGINQLRSGDPTVDGWDRQIATNHLGPFLLTTSVLDLLERAPAARVVGTASEAHRAGGRLDPVTFERPTGFGIAGAQLKYGQSKLLNILFTRELARRTAGSGVTANCFCPGAVASGLMRGSVVVDRVARAAGRGRILRRPEEGARMGLRLVLDPHLADVSGEFFTSTPGLRLLPPVRSLSDFELQRDIWRRSAELVAL
ncbi:putative oxidoreductase, SDR-family [Nocardia nova SH22a]|uniref:Putative oxidoreductase, SDR-family n=1 Tax=Nocardia nova SH22a TaxID=1415166 RepID=W5TLX9_9NOCA|nr:SDR family NAD(P)-dependent oxidoreductase [Nocardia nova]AHH19963.1 putative oxidoreductase, SDR-family [Nocardia nova SH22a]